jgi:putative sigma-54 modulation protein
MELHVKGKNLEVNESIRSYAERRLRKLDRRLHDSTVVELELAEERNPSIAESQVAEATVHLKGRTLRVREAERDMRTAIDQLADKLVRQVKDIHDKRVARKKHVGKSEPGEQPDLENPVEAGSSES